MLSDKWDDEYEKLEKLCEDNQITFHVQKDTFPVRFTIEPSIDEMNQMSLIDDEPKNGIAMEFIFSEELVINFIGDFRIDDELLNKIKNAVKKLHYIWLQIWFMNKEHRWNQLAQIISHQPDTNNYNLVYLPACYQP